jgi:hypothetical protein
VEDRAESQNKLMQDLNVKILLFKQKIMLKSHIILPNPRVLSKHKVNTYAALYFYGFKMWLTEKIVLHLF